MFVLFGTSTIKTRVSNSPVKHVFCNKCNRVTEMHDHMWQRFFTLFFIPIFPVDEKEFVITCSVCNSSYKQVRESAPKEVTKHSNKKITAPVICIKCGAEFFQIHTQCPLCQYDSAGRAECSYCHKKIEQFEFIKNHNRCPYCNSVGK
jgi:hypothetical protein